MSHLIYTLARALTWLGALILAAISVLSVVSIVGRALTRFGLSPVPGDFELVEVGTALAVFCFLPWAHLKGGHAFVDILWGKYSLSMKRALTIAFDALMLLVWALLTWRLFHGMVDYRAAGEETFILHLPIWWAYAGCVALSTLGLVIYVWRLLESLGLAKPPAGFALASGGH